MIQMLTNPRFWARSGAALHAAWAYILVLFLAGDLETWVTNWVVSHRSPTLGGPAYIIAIGYILKAIGLLVPCAIACSIVGFVLWQRSQRRLHRIAHHLCPTCAYPISTWGTPVCTECGAAIPVSHQRSAMSR